jgi:hypothetical protein
MLIVACFIKDILNCKALSFTVRYPPTAGGEKLAVDVLEERMTNIFLGKSERRFMESRTLRRFKSFFTIKDIKTILVFFRKFKKHIKV